jgi:hypothetical protein
VSETIAPDQAAADLSPAAVSERLPAEPEAIFVVGVARSGTTMMRYLLETSDRVAIARENHFMGHFFGRRGARHFFRGAGDLEEDATIRRIVDMIYSGEYAEHSRWRDVSPYWRWLTEAVPREELELRLLAAERTERGLFATFMRIYADMASKPVMGEKTPTHLAHVDTLLEWYPDARVIHMLRDPRAVYVSDRHRRRTKGRKPYTWLMKVPLLLETYLLLLTSVTWRRALRRHAEYQRRHPGRYLLVRFEDVVLRPNETVPRIFRFLGVAMPADFESVQLSAAHGMRSSSEGIDPDAADRWRERIHPFAKRWLELFLGRQMRRFGYTA